MEREMIVFVLGGARSGKTRWALNYGEKMKNFKNFYYIATAQALDEEMKRKIERHKKERSKKWKVIEEPIYIWSVLEEFKNNCVVLIDCLTLWLANIFLKKMAVEEIIEKFVKSLKNFKGKEENLVIIVSNEVGTGIVPENKTAREYREYMGFLNQKVAEISDKFYFIIAGHALNLKN